MPSRAVLCRALLRSLAWLLAGVNGFGSFAIRLPRSKVYGVGLETVMGLFSLAFFFFFPFLCRFFWSGLVWCWIG